MSLKLSSCSAAFTDIIASRTTPIAIPIFQQQQQRQEHIINLRPKSLNVFYTIVVFRALCRKCSVVLHGDFSDRCTNIVQWVKIQCNNLRRLRVWRRSTFSRPLLQKCNVSVTWPPGCTRIVYYSSRHCSHNVHTRCVNDFRLGPSVD